MESAHLVGVSDHMPFLFLPILNHCGRVSLLDQALAILVLMFLRLGSGPVPLIKLGIVRWGRV
jgi:hypothetical protein